MFYTTYFAKLRSLPEDIIPVAICAKPPIGFKGYTFRQLAPKYDAFKHYMTLLNTIKKLVIKNCLLKLLMNKY